MNSAFPYNGKCRLLLSYSSFLHSLWPGTYFFTLKFQLSLILWNAILMTYFYCLLCLSGLIFYLFRLFDLLWYISSMLLNSDRFRGLFIHNYTIIWHHNIIILRRFYNWLMMDSTIILAALIISLHYTCTKFRSFLICKISKNRIRTQIHTFSFPRVPKIPAIF